MRRCFYCMYFTTAIKSIVDGSDVKVDDYTRYIRINTNSGWCRRYPPERHVAADNTDVERMNRWPQVAYEDVCGEFKES